MIALLAICTACNTDRGVDEFASEQTSEPLASTASGIQPDPQLSVEEVVEIQLEALRKNDDQDSGIEIAYRFSSPKNRSVTGPFERFAEMIKSPIYDMLLRHVKSDSLPVYMNGSEARKFVVLESNDGDLECYLFILNRQKDGPYRECWMVDAVIRGTLEDESSRLSFSGETKS